MKTCLSALLLSLCGIAPVLAQDTGDAATRAFVDALPFRTGAIDIADADVQLTLGERFKYLDAAAAQRVLEELWGNPPDDSVLGLVMPAAVDLASDASWAVVVTYSADGHVSDEDAGSIDYTEMLAELQSDTAADNEARIEAGYGGIELLGWAESPRYDAASHKLYWAKDLRFDGQYQTLNYDVRVLGRHGYLSLNAVGSIDQLDQIRDGMQQLLPLAEFNAGARYADYNAGTDKLAAYGLAALVGGGLAAKTGMLGKLLALLIGAKKILIPLLIGGGVLLTRLFGRKKAA